MAKMNNTRKSDSWRPGMANGSGMVSKNQKRKEKRYSHNLSSLKSQDTPTKKSLLGPLAKFKENVNQSLNLPAGKKENKLLSTSLPIKGDKKSTPLLKNVKPTGILSNSNTPKSKGNKVTFNMAKNVDKFIDSEAVEGEEPITDKVVKPYEKGSKQKQQLKRRMSMMENESDDEDSESDDDTFGSASQFVDMEASEGEETDSAEDESDEDSDDAFLTGDSDEEVDDEEISDDVGSEDDDMDSEDDEDEEDSDEESEDDEEETSPANTSKVATPNRRQSVADIALKKEKGTPLSKKVAVKPEPVSPQSKKVDVKTQNAKAGPDSQKEKLATATPVKGKAQATVEKSQSQDKAKKEKKKEETVIGETSPYVGIVRKIFNKVSLENVKSALCKKIDANKIIGLRLARERNVFVFLEDEDTLDSLLNQSFTVNENFKFVVYKARDSSSDKKPKFVAFMPKVPIAKTVAEVKEAIGKYVGSENVEAVKFRRVFKFQQVRHVLVHFTDEESLKKMVQKGDVQIGSDKVIIRAAYETTVKVPMYKVLFTSIPEKTTEAILKKAIESHVGKDTVENIQFSQKKASFAFVTMKNEEALKKSLEVGSNVSVNGTKLEAVEFKTRAPGKKRAAPSEQAKERKKNKAKKQKLADGSAKSDPSPGKKNKASHGSPKANAQKPPQKGAAAQSKPENANSAGQEVVAKSKKKQFNKPGKGAKANQQSGSPKGPVSAKGANPKQKPQSPANGPAPGKGADSKRQQKKFKKGAASPQSPNPVNGASPSNPKQKKNKNKQQQQHSPKPVDAKKQALVEKIVSKKKNKKNSMRRDAS